MASSEKPSTESNQPSRRDNAVRIAKYGALAGLVMGFFGGGGLVGAVKLAMVYGGAGALGGAVAGDKLNPVFDKIAGLFGRGKKEGNCGQKPEGEEAACGPSRSVAATVAPSLAEETFVGTPTYNPVKSVSGLDEVRSAATKAIDDAGQGMDPNTPAAMPQNFVPKKPTHPGTQRLQ